MRRKKFGDQEIQHDGATERIVYARKLWGKKRIDDYTEYRSSFALNNGEYAYQDWDEDNQREFFHVVKIRDPNVFKLLDEADHDEEKDDRHAEEASDYAQLRYEAMAEAQEEEALASPLEKAEYQMWLYPVSEEQSRPFPMDPAHAIIRCLVEQLPPAERETYDLLFNSGLSEDQIKELLHLDDNAWWNRKKRLDNDVRGVFRGLGYQVPAYEEIELEQERYIKRSGRNPKKIREKLEKQKKGA